MKKALIVTPYLDHLGGGERYMLEAASVIKNSGFQVYFAWENRQQIDKLTKILGIELNEFELDKNVLPLYFGSHSFAMWQATRGYDLVLYMSDGSIPLLGGKRNILHMQVPYHDVGGKSYWSQIKLKNIHKVIVNSSFTKKVIDREYKINSTVIYPPHSAIEAGKKSKVILSVGRFDRSRNIKKQDLLIEAFRLLSPQLPGWKLVLAGGSSDEAWQEELLGQIKGLKVELKFNATYQELCAMYSHASIYWHAAGYGVDEKASPEMVEHFGITTVEAISAGCIPLVVGKGGQTEIVKNGLYHWETVDELIEKTLKFSSIKDTPKIDISRFNSFHFKSSIRDVIIP